MTKVVANNYPRSISQYVPNMEFAADVVGDTHIVNLGSPAALDADGIFDGVTADATTGGNTYTSSDFKTTFDWFIDFLNYHGWDDGCHLWALSYISRLCWF